MQTSATIDRPGVSRPVADISVLSLNASILDDPGGFLSTLSLATRMQIVSTAVRDPDVTSYLFLGSAESGTPVLAAAPVSHARTWRAAPDPAIASGIAVCRLAPDALRARLAAFSEAFGLPPAVARSLVALYEHGDTREAARATGVSFNTGRDYLKRARAAVMAPNLARLITWAGVGSLGEDATAESDVAAEALFSLSARQRRLAGLVADGLTRAEAARALGVSEAVAKKELAAAFVATGVSSAIGLARLFADLRGLTMITRPASLPEAWPPPFSRLLTVVDGAGRRIAASDYGPPGAPPVIVLHNTMNCRGIDRALVAALQDAGYRPISPDRPGYGDTDPAPAHAQGDAYLRVCAEDMGVLCDRMGWRRAAWIAHGPVQVVLALRCHRPDLIGRAVIDAPEPDSGWGAQRKGGIPNLKRTFARRPWAVASALRILFALSSQERVAAFMRESTGASPADRRAMEDPALLMDFYRKIIPFRRGRLDGLVREQVLQATAQRPAPIPGTTELTLLIGATDFMHDPGRTMAYWSAVLPDARFEVLPDAGRFISYSHPTQLVAALAAS